MTTQDTIRDYASQYKRACHDGCDGHNSNHSLYWEGRVLYSYGYHYPLAVLINDNTAAINTQGYSVTTGKHTSWTHWELKQQGYNVIESFTAAMQEIASYARLEQQDKLDTFKTNTLAYLEDKQEHAQGKQERARVKHSIARWEREAQDYSNQIEQLEQLIA